MSNISSKLDSLAKPFEGITPWLLRLSLGISFFLHGYGKFPLPPEKMVGWFSSMGIPAPDVVSSLVALGEAGAGIGIIVGGLRSRGGYNDRRFLSCALRLVHHT